MSLRIFVLACLAYQTRADAEETDSDAVAAKSVAPNQSGFRALSSLLYYSTLPSQRSSGGRRPYPDFASDYGPSYRGGMVGTNRYGRSHGRGYQSDYYSYNSGHYSGYNRGRYGAGMDYNRGHYGRGMSYNRENYYGTGMGYNRDNYYGTGMGYNRGHYGAGMGYNRGYNSDRYGAGMGYNRGYYGGSYGRGHSRGRHSEGHYDHWADDY